MNRTIKVAFGSVPKDGGTFTFYRTVRPALRQHGVEMFCVSLGRKEAGLWQNEFADEGCVLLAAEANDLKRQARAFAAWCDEAHIDKMIKSILWKAFPGHRDKSNYQDDYFDFCWMVN